MACVAIFPFVLIVVLWKRRIGRWQDAFLIASIIWGTALVALTECLSHFDQITPRGLFTGWLVISAIVASVTPLIPRQIAEPAPSSKDRLVHCIVGFLMVMAVLLAIVAWIGPPNNADSMTYHLARVFHWMQDRNVAPYPVQSYPPDRFPLLFFNSQQVRQITMPPGAEYIILNLQVLSGSERLSSFVQWFAYLGCLIGVWSIARRMGATPRGQAIAALIAGTAPIVCLEAATTQNDLVMTYWLVCFVWTLPRVNARRFDALLCGASLGLALLTKATAYLYAAPFVLALAIVLLKKRQWRATGILACIVVTAFLINLPMYIANASFEGTPLGDVHDDLVYTNSPISVGNSVSNVIRNVALEFAFPRGKCAHGVERVARALHHVLGLNADDLGSTFPMKTFDLSEVKWNDEDSAPNPFHVVLIVAVVISLVLTRKQHWRQLLYMAALLAGFLAFCVEVRWQPWHSRQHMALIALAGPVAGLAMAQWNQRAVGVICLSLAAIAGACVAANVHHPLIGAGSIFTHDRQTVRFAARTRFQQPFEQIAALAPKYRQVGFIFTDDDWEYPLAMMLKEKNPAIRVETYRSPWLLDPHTRNRGWDENLKPSLVIQFNNGVPTIVSE